MTRARPEASTGIATGLATGATTGPTNWPVPQHASEPATGLATRSLPQPASDPAIGASTGLGRSYRLVSQDGQPYSSPVPGTIGGHRKGRRYGRLDCPAARRALARGGYVRDRVFFADPATARAAGYRPCAACLPQEYAAWKATRAP